MIKKNFKSSKNLIVKYVMILLMAIILLNVKIVWNIYVNLVIKIFNIKPAHSVDNKELIYLFNHNKLLIMIMMTMKIHLLITFYL